MPDIRLDSRSPFSNTRHRIVCGDRVLDRGCVRVKLPPSHVQSPMVSERVKGQIDRLLVDAEDASAQRDWEGAAVGLSTSGRLTHRVSADSPSWPLPQGHWREPLDHPQKHRFPWRHQPLHPSPCPLHRPTTAIRQMTSLATAGSEGRAIRLSSGMRCSQRLQCRFIKSGSA